MDLLFRFCCLLAFITFLTGFFDHPVLNFGVLGLLLRQRSECGGQLTESLDESLIKIGKSQKDLYITYQLGFRPIMYGLDLLFFYLDALMEDNVAHLILVKSTLLEIGIQ